MVKKKGKSSRKGKRRVVKEDVKYSTSLPPAVEGQLRCFLRVSITKIDWTIAKPPDITHVRLQWWGEATEGTVFRPLDVKNPQKSMSRTTARFPVRCGPKQFTAYLNDMGTLQLEILKGVSMNCIGMVQINEIGHLAPQIPINGSFPVFSKKDPPGKIADLHVSMAFEPLPSSYDSSSSMPTTDISLAGGSVATDTSVRRHQPHPSSQHPVPHPSSRPASLDEAIFISPITQTVDDQRVTTPRGIDSDYSFVIGPGADRKTSSLATDIQTVHEATQGPRNVHDRVNHMPSRYQSASHDHVARKSHSAPVDVSMSSRGHGLTSRHHSMNPTSKTGQDLISALLDRGTKLRDAMVVSEVQPRQKVDIDPSGGSPPRREPGALRRSSSGELFREILDTDDKERQYVSPPKEEESFNTEMKTVELLIGDQLSKRELNSLKALQAGATSPPSSVSSHSDRENMSELEDPVHDTSILEELFYKGLRSSSDDNLSDLLSSDTADEDDRKVKKKSKKKRRRSVTPDINDPGNRRPPSRRSSSSQQGTISTTPPTSDRPSFTEPAHMDSSPMPSNIIEHKDKTEDISSGSDSDTGSTSRMSDGSRVSFDGPQEEQSQVSPSQGLSVERLTLLGKVHIARVMVDTLSLEPNDDENTPSRPSLVRSNRASRMRGKPPRPVSRTPKKSYFVEYQFPVVASSRDKSLVNTMATEVMRLVSKKVSESEASFGHRSVFPVSFNGTAVDRWWKQMVVFKIFSRTPGQKTPTLLGVSSLRLRQVLQSPDLAIQQALPVHDKSSPHHQRGQSHSSSRSSEEDSTPRNTAPEIGTLKVTVELGSDNKDFSMAVARTKLAEMRGAKIVPLPSNQTRLPIQIQTTGASSSTTTTSSSSRKQKKRTSQGIQTEQDQQDISQRQIPPHVHDSESPRGAERQGVTVEEAVKNKRQVHQEDQQVDRAKDSEGLRQQVQYVDRTEPTMKPQSTDHEGLTLHSLLLIPEGRGITMQGVIPVNRSDKYPQPQQQKPHPTGWSGWGSDRDMATRNTYLVCRMFWSDDSVRSNVCWGTPEPNYNFIQVAPVLVTPSLLERTRNNVMVIEVWDKKTSAQNDQLVGIAKVSLHQLYMSFRDRRIASTLLKSQFPVVAVDNYVNITDPFSGTQYGQIKVLLALGSMEQISALQRLKCDKDIIVDVRPERPVNYLERGEPSSSNRDAASYGDGMVEHVFEVVVEGVRGMTQLDDSYWGEADCFVQYHFPSQPQEQAAAPGQPIHAGAPVLKPHRSATTLCVPDPTFHDVSRHRIVLPQGIPAQRELLTACAGVGGGVGGIPFEVWCRYYYPNIRDQVAAKTTLPLAKLCAMVTMQRRGEPSVQTFSLPLKMQHVEEENLTPEQKAKIQDAGLLDVTISYKNAVVRESTRNKTTSDPGGPHVCMSVGIIRACGLKMAARHLAQFDAGIQYASEVGVNAYVKMELSFLAKEDMRISRTIARTFSPEFSHHVDFPCPMLLTDGDNDAMSLAESLETAEMKLQVWHQTPGFRPDHKTDYRQLDVGSAPSVSGRQLIPGSVDVLLGTAVIPLYSLLTHRTGIQGWFPLTIPSQGWAATSVSNNDPTSQSDTPKEATSHQGLERVGGGLELAIKFAHPNDREKVVDAARSIGWSPHGIVDDAEIWEEDHDDMDRAVSSTVTIHTDAAWFPDFAALRPGQDTLDGQAKAYIRYKFYDKAAICSKLCYVDIGEDGYVTADFKHSQRFQAAHTQPFTWYLREERLEVQLWMSYNQDHPGQDQPRPRHRDKLIGCAYVDLSPLIDKRSKHHRVSGLYPLFKPGASNLGGACLRIHVNMETSHRRHGDQDELDTTDDIPIPSYRSTSGVRQRHSSTDKQKIVEDWLEDEQAQEIERQRKAKEEEERRLAEEEAQRNRPVSMKVLIERAMHLPVVQDARGLHTVAPSCYVTFQSAEEPLVVQTTTVMNTNHPTWGYEANVKVSKEVLDNQCFVMKLWHQTGSAANQGSDRVLGFCSIDMGPLMAGFRSLNGWYNIMDFSGQCHGQIKVSITPCESLSPLKKPPKQRTLTMSPNTSSIFVPGVSYIIPHPAPPGVNTSLSSENQVLSSVQGHFEKHLKNIRKFHQDLQDRLKVHLPDVPQGDENSKELVAEHRNTVFVQEPPVPSSVTSSFLVQNLRKNLQELDLVHQKLQQKLSKSEIRNHTEPPRLDSISSQQSSGTGPQVINDDRAEQSSESNSIASEITRSSNQPYHHEHAFDDVQDGLPTMDEQNQDARGLVGSPSEHSENWEDSVQFDGGGDILKPSEEHHQEMLHQFRDPGEFDGDLSDVVVPKALNDISSAHFGHNAGADFMTSYPATKSWTSANLDNGAGADFMPSYPNPQSQMYEEQNQLLLRLNDDDSLPPGNRKPDDQRHAFVMDDVRKNEMSVGSNIESYGEDEHKTRYASDQNDDQRSIKSTSGSDSSDDENHYRSQESRPPRSAHIRTLPQATSQTLQSSEQRMRILADTTNRQHDIQSKERAIHRNTKEKMDSQRDIPVLVEQMSGHAKDTSNDSNIPSVSTYHRAKIASRHTLEDHLKNLSEQTQDPIPDNSSIPRPALDGTDQLLGRTQSHEAFERQRSLSLSSDDSVVLTIDPEVAERQQRLMQQRTVKPSVPSAMSTSAPVPNFFLPPQDLEASMRALHNAVTFLPRGQPRDGDMQSDESSSRTYQKAQAAAELASRLGGGFSSAAPMATQHPPEKGAGFGLNTRKPKLNAPSADEAKRIAKIFGSKYSMQL
ncbi:C2 domain-containing protein 3-like [Amphiura filiformis]|uniref:C2 domain-containing protein 3-like n=1 Tax=Amphiura filiformis TaxID=82378 RepID=UPI003B2165C1